MTPLLRVMMKMRIGTSTTTAKGDQASPFKVRSSQTMMRRTSEGCNMREESRRMSSKMKMMTSSPVMETRKLVPRINQIYRSKKHQAVGL